MSVDKKKGYKEVLGAIAAGAVVSVVYAYGWEIGRWIKEHWPF